MVSEEDVRKALKHVIDPELNINIVDLGLIYEIKINGNLVKVKMTLTSPGCPIGPQLLSSAQQVIENIEEVEKAEVELTFEPMWSIEKASPEVQAMMKEYV